MTAKQVLQLVGSSLNGPEETAIWGQLSVCSRFLVVPMFDLFTYLITYLFTPWTRVFLEKLTGFQLVEKLPAFYGTRRFITAFTSARHLSLS